MVIRSFKELDAYRRAFELQQRVFVLSQEWPKEERYSLIDQIRRSSRSIGANLAEAWAKRRYPAHFLSKLSDADGELQETGHWLATALACGYLAQEECGILVNELESIGRQLGAMMAKHESFCSR